MLAKFCQKIRMSKLNATRVGGSVSSAIPNKARTILRLATVSTLRMATAGPCVKGCNRFDFIARSRRRQGPLVPALHRRQRKIISPGSL